MSTSSRHTPLTVGDYIRDTSQVFAGAGLSYGHGTDDPVDEAAWLVFAVLDLPHNEAQEHYDRRITDTERARLDLLVGRRIDERIPVAYLVNEAWFAGFEFYVDARVLVPRSPIAELILSHFSPWLTGQDLRRALDVGTGSGCIAIAIAKVFPRAVIDAVDVSGDALAVAGINAARHGVERRVNLIRSDFFADLPAKQYNLIVSNPPYVDAQEMSNLEPEFTHEPALGLESGIDGLDAAVTLLRDAAGFLADEGVLILEVGNSANALQNRFPGVDFVWLEFEHGGGGVCLLDKATLLRHQVVFQSG